MSVSLREQIVEILVSNDMCVSIADDKDGVADQILALFPPQLTEEEVEILINKVKAETDPIAFTSVLAQALIGKCATEQKECLHDGDKMGGSDCPTTCCKCGKELFGKPIPAEKCCCGQIEMSGDMTVIVVGKEVHCKTKPCYITDKPEPKPKDRIEIQEILYACDYGDTDKLYDYVNQLINKINEIICAIAEMRERN
jgi:hypothetical protein